MPPPIGTVISLLFTWTCERCVGVIWCGGWILRHGDSTGDDGWWMGWERHCISLLIIIAIDYRWMWKDVELEGGKLSSVCGPNRANQKRIENPRVEVTLAKIHYLHTVTNIARTPGWSDMTSQHSLYFAQNRHLPFPHAYDMMPPACCPPLLPAGHTVPHITTNPPRLDSIMVIEAAKLRH